MAYNWISVQTAAELLDVSVSAIHKTIEKYCEGEKYVFRCIKGKGRGGKQYEILLESLPQSAQDKYNGIISKQQQSDNDVIAHLTNKNRDDTCRKYNIVCAYERFKKENHFRGKQQAFIAQYNEEHPDKPINKNKLEHYCRQYKKGGAAALIDRRGNSRAGQVNVPDEMWEVFKKLWLRTSKPSKQICYDMTKEYFEQQGKTVPHISSFKRMINKLPDIVIARYREGKKYYEDRYLPYIPQDYSNTYSNQLWIGDHHVFDVLVVDEDGNVFRPWLSAWEDLHSRMIVGYVINRIEPNSDIVLDSFARGCHAHGIPDGVKIDNGKDYQTYDLFNKDFSMSICNTMGIKVTSALPYNAKAKPIERLFRTIEDRYCRLLDCYIGNAPHNRPEEMRKLNKQLKNKAMPYSKFLVYMDNVIKTYNTTYHSTIKTTPLEAYKNGFAKPMRIVLDTDVLNAFLMRTSKPIKVGRNGIRVPSIGYYYDDIRLSEYIGKEVYARYNSEDIRKIYIFDENNTLICSAKNVELSAHDSPVTMEYIRELQRKKKTRNKFAKEQLDKNISVPTLDEFVGKKSARFEDMPTDSGIIKLNPVTYNQAKEMKKEDENHLQRNTEGNKEKPKENVYNTREFNKQLAEFYKKAGGI